MQWSCAILYWHVWPIWVYYTSPPDLISGTSFWGKHYWTYNVGSDFPHILKHFFFKEELSDMLSWIYIDLHVKYSLFCSYLNETWIFWTDFRKILQFQISWTFFPVEAELSHVEGETDGQTDNVTTMIVTFRSFANASKNRQRPITYWFYFEP